MSQLCTKHRITPSSTFIAEISTTIDQEDDDPICHLHVIPEDSDEENDSNPQTDDDSPEPRYHPRVTDLNLEGLVEGGRPVVIEDEEERQHTTAASEFLSFQQSLDIDRLRRYK